MLKIVHISSYDNGGAGGAALRLHLGLLASGVDSVFLCGVKTSNAQNVIEFRQKKSLFQSTFFRTPFNAAKIPIDKYNRNLQRLSKLSGDFEVFTFPDSESDILSHPAVKKADIINLHWVAKYLDYPSFFKNIKKPVVWTLHDMNPFQGGFHYYNDVVRNMKQFGRLENRLRKQKEALIQQCKNLTVVAPSSWLTNIAGQSEAFKQAASFHTIPNGVSTESFKDYGIIAREIFDLPKDKIIISFVSSDIHNFRKGFDMLYEAIQRMGDLDDVIFCAVGSAPGDLIRENVRYLGNIRDERLMSLVYTASDGYVLPSREDNLPNVMIEAMACGTPVLSFPIGGMLDVIRPNFNGNFATEISSNSLAEGLSLFIKNITKYDRQQIRRNIIDHYSLPVQAKNYINLYNEIASKK